MQRLEWRLVTFANLKLCVRFLQAWKALDRLLGIPAEVSISGACLRHGAYRAIRVFSKCGALLPRNHRSQAVGRSDARSRRPSPHLAHIPIPTDDHTNHQILL